MIKKKNLYTTIAVVFFIEYLKILFLYVSGIPYERQFEFAIGGICFIISVLVWHQVLFGGDKHDESNI